MRLLYRIAALLACLVVLIACVPDPTRNVGSSAVPTADVAQHPVPVIADSRVVIPAGTPALEQTPNTPAAQPSRTPTVQPPSRAPGEPPVSLPAEDLMLELKLARRAITSKPYQIPASPVEKFNIFVHFPPSAAQKGQSRVLLLLHGMGGQGDKFAQPFIAEADRNNWVIIAPTMPYVRDYMDPAQLVEEDVYLGHSLHAMLDALPDQLGIKLRKHVLLFGFSRGAQLATRFALFHPDYVETIASISGGSYTLPMNNSDDKRVMQFPFGTADLQQKLGWPLDWDRFKSISFWIAVGAKDNRPNEVARAFDNYIGRNRVERAQKFEAALAKMGIDAHLTIFQNADHEVTDEMRSAALKFLRQDELADHLDD